MIHCIETAGHTEGTMSFFFDVEDNGHIWHAGTFGGAGFITMYKSSLHGMACRILQPNFYRSLEKMKAQNVTTGAGKSSSHRTTTLQRWKKSLQIRMPEIRSLTRPARTGRIILHGLRQSSDNLWKMDAEPLSLLQNKGEQTYEIRKNITKEGMICSAASC